MAASICSTPYDAQKNMCSLEQLKALASTARQARAKYFSERYLIGSIPSSPDETYEHVDPLQKTLNVTQPGVAFSAGLGRGFVSCLGCVLLRHVFALTGRAVKRRALPVVNAGLCVNPHLAVAAAGRLRISHLLIGATR